MCIIAGTPRSHHTLISTELPYPAGVPYNGTPSSPAAIPHFQRPSFPPSTGEQPICNQRASDAQDPAAPCTHLVISCPRSHALAKPISSITPKQATPMSISLAATPKSRWVETHLAPTAPSSQIWPVTPTSRTHHAQIKLAAPIFPIFRSPITNPASITSTPKQLRPSHLHEPAASPIAIDQVASLGRLQQLRPPSAFCPSTSSPLVDNDPPRSSKPGDADHTPITVAIFPSARTPSARASHP
ncbi:hypothetical protein ACLOJK_029019 [Asimina triloba]